MQCPSQIKVIYKDCITFVVLLVIKVLVISNWAELGFSLWVGVWYTLLVVSGGL